jgi:Peptidase family M1 domain
MRPRAALLVSLLALSCATADPWFRNPEARETTTIFSPLDLPAPSDVRGGSGAPGPEYWQQQVDYAIDVSLDPETRVVAGKAHVTYHNNSPDALDYLWVHLEQNSFRDDGLAGAVAGRRPDGTRRGGSEGYTLESFSTPEGGALNFTEMDLVGRLDLPAPLAPGNTFAFDMAWHFKVPEQVFRRFGTEKVEQGTVWELAQWFPCVAVYDDVYGWNTLPYAGRGEFYTNFGNYDVRITVPRAHLVVATGVLQNPQEVYTAEQQERWEQARACADTVMIRTAEEVALPESRPPGVGPLTWHFKSERVRTVAFASSDAFIIDAASLDGTPESTLLISAYPKEGQKLWRHSTQMLRAAMRGFNTRWFPYPWPVMTNVNGREGGMEYPMIIFCGGRRDERALYSVTAHELGHEWFPMLVNTDERRHAWMDEGFNTFIDYYAQWDWFSEPEHDAANRNSRGNPARFATTQSSENMLPIDTPPDRLPQRLISPLQYTKTGAGLVLLRESILGPERFDFAFRTYIRRWAFKSPQPADFYRTMEDAAGTDLSWFWRGWFQETGTLDQAVMEVEQPVPDSRNGAGEIVYLPGSVTIENRGELVMPLVFKVTFEGGEERTIELPVEIWATTNKWNEPILGSTRIAAVVVDPDEALPDVARGNNSWKQIR